MMVFVKYPWTIGVFSPIRIKFRTFRRNPESESFRSSVVSAGPFRPESFWQIFGLFGLDLIHLFRTLEKDIWNNGCILSHLQSNCDHPRMIESFGFVQELSSCG